MSNEDSYQSLFQEGMKLVDGRVNLDGCALPEPGFFEKRRLLKGVRLLEQAAVVEPPYGAASLFAAKVYERLGRNKESLRWMRKAQSVAPDNMIVALELGGVLSKLGLHTEAVAVLTEAAKQNPHDPRVHSNLGVSLLLSGDAKASVAAFSTLVALEPNQQTNIRLLNLAVAVHEGRESQPMSEAQIIRSL